MWPRVGLGVAPPPVLLWQLSQRPVLLESCVQVPPAKVAVVWQERQSKLVGM